MTMTTVKRSSRFVESAGIDGQVDMKLIYGIKGIGTQHKGRREGAYHEEESAARAYDLAALKYWGTSTFTNLSVLDYESEIEKMNTLTKKEFLASLRRRSSDFSRGVSKYRGVARHHHNWRWEARIGRVFENKFLYLGTYGTQEEAAHAYVIAAIEYRGINVVTNFDLKTYIRWQRPRANSLGPQELKSNADQLLPMPSSSDGIPPSKEGRQMSMFQPNSFTVDDIDTSKNGDIFPRQQQQQQQPSMAVSPFTKSSPSPTALGLILQSSGFKELVEKNLNGDNEESEKNDLNLLPVQNNSDNIKRILYEGMRNNPFTCSSNSNVLPALESQEESLLPLSNSRDQPLWNGALNMFTSPDFNQINFSFSLSTCKHSV